MENVDAGGVHCEYINPYFSHAHKHTKKEPDGSFGIINLHLVSNSAHQSSISISSIHCEDQMTRILCLNLDIELYKLQILRSNSQALLFLDDFDPKCLGVPNLSKSHKSDA